MPHVKHHEYTANKQDITYTEIKRNKYPQKQRMLKAEKSPINYAELTFHRKPQLLSENQVVRGERQDPKATVWRTVTGVLGALCIALLTVAGILLPRPENSETFSLKIPEKRLDSSCDLCLHDWIAFGNNFYHIFNGLKTWADSQSACEELNSHLVKIDSKAELENLQLFEIYGWIFPKTNTTDEARVCKNTTQIDQIRTNNSKGKNRNCTYMSGKKVYYDDCSSRKPYICESNIA